MNHIKACPCQIQIYGFDKKEDTNRYSRNSRGKFIFLFHHFVEFHTTFAPCKNSRLTFIDRWSENSQKQSQNNRLYLKIGQIAENVPHWVGIASVCSGNMW